MIKVLTKPPNDKNTFQISMINIHSNLQNDQNTHKTHSTNQNTVKISKIPIKYSIYQHTPPPQKNK